jgi:hypothetical protein
MRRAITVPILLVTSILCFATPSHAETQILESVTACHIHTNTLSGFEYRILELDGSESVAMNPTYLYLVITNNASGDLKQTSLVKLPSVVSISNIAYDDNLNQIILTAHIERSDETGKNTITSIEIIKVACPIDSTGRLKEATITRSISKN